MHASKAMHANKQRCPSSLRALSVTLGIALAVLWPLGAASATGPGAQPTGTPTTSTTVQVAPSGPQLSITVDNGRTSAAVGDRPTYTITISNLGSTQVTGLVVTQSVPTGLSFTSADSAGIAKAGLVSWFVDLKASGKATLHTTMTVSKSPKELLRLATVACASVSAKGPPIVCATDSDLLPAGASAEGAKAEGRAKPAKRTGAAATSAGRTGWYITGGLGGIAILVGGMVLMTRKRKLGKSVHRG